MAYYIAVHPNPAAKIATVWQIDNGIATRLDAQQGPYRVGKVGGALSFDDDSGMSTFKLLPLKIAPGGYHPNMARPRSDIVTETPGISPNVSNDLVQSSCGQLIALQERLELIFRTVHPEEPNFETYGHEIRNLLILAATENEAHWKGVLRANGVQGSSTADYVKLLPAMKLDGYALTLPLFPWLNTLRPFAGWDPSLPTQSLSWYSSYNAVKHDREENFRQATLLAAVKSVCAVAVMNYAQFGLYADNRAMRSFFKLAEAPFWSPSETYCIAGPFTQTPVPYPF